MKIIANSNFSYKLTNWKAKMKNKTRTRIILILRILWIRNFSRHLKFFDHLKFDKPTYKNDVPRLIYDTTYSKRTKYKLRKTKVLSGMVYLNQNMPLQSFLKSSKVIFKFYSTNSRMFCPILWLHQRLAFPL